LKSNWLVSSSNAENINENHANATNSNQGKCKNTPKPENLPAMTPKQMTLQELASFLIAGSLASLDGTLEVVQPA
jgi:hypothetical protein